MTTMINGIPYFVEPKVNENVALSATATNLNAIASFFPKPVVGDLYCGIGKVTGTTLNAMVADTLYATPFIIPYTFTASAVSVNVTTAHDTKHIRVGIYNHALGLPTTVFVDFGIITMTAAAGIYSITGLAQSIPAGQYFAGLISDGTPQVMRWTDYLMMRRGYTADVNTYNYGGGYSKAAVGYGALATFPGTPTVITSGMGLMTLFTVASVP